MNTLINEKRRYQRFKPDCAVLYRGTDLFGAGRCPDVSLSGLQLLCSDEIPINTILTIELVSLLLRPNPVRITGKVIWTKRDDQAKMNRIGISFICNFALGTKFLSETFAMKNRT